MTDDPNKALFDSFSDQIMGTLAHLEAQATARDKEQQVMAMIEQFFRLHNLTSREVIFTDMAVIVDAPDLLARIGDLIGYVGK